MGCPVCEKAAELESRAPVEPPVLSQVIRIDANGEPHYESAPPVLSRAAINQMIEDVIQSKDAWFRTRRSIELPLYALRDAILESLSHRKGN